MTPASRVGGPGPERHRFPRRARIRRTEDIRGAFRHGRRLRTPSMDVFVRAQSSAEGPRLGVVVPKLGRNIVDRNLLRRRLREIGRKRVLPALSAASRNDDLLIRVRREAYDSSYRQLECELVDVVERVCSGSS